MGEEAEAAAEALTAEPKRGCCREAVPTTGEPEVVDEEAELEEQMTIFTFAGKEKMTQRTKDARRKSGREKKEEKEGGIVKVNENNYLHVQLQCHADAQELTLS